MFSFFLRLRLVYISREEGCDEVMTQQLPCVFGSGRGCAKEPAVGALLGSGSFGTLVFRGTGPAVLSHAGAARSTIHSQNNPWHRENRGRTAAACARARPESSGAETEK